MWYNEAVAPGDRNRIDPNRILTNTNNWAGSEPNQNLRGGRFWEGRPVYGAFNTVLPPNSPNCHQGASAEGAVTVHMSASSFHTGGVNGGMFDGAVRFIPETIDFGGGTQGSGNPPTGPSRYGIWGALGSPNGGESLSL